MKTQTTTRLVVKVVVKVVVVIVVVIIAGKKRATEISLSGVVFRYREDGEAKAGKRDVILCARTCVSFSCISGAFFLQEYSYNYYN